MAWLPQGFKTESSNNRYTRLDIGQTKLRILSEPIVGQVFWVERDGQRKPIRKQIDEKIVTSELDSDSEVRQFIAVKVYNYDEQAVQLWEITQKTIMEGLNNYAENEAYGDPRGYDVVVTKQGVGMKTKYTVVANPPTEISKEVQEADDTLDVELKALYDGRDPFIPLKK